MKVKQNYFANGKGGTVFYASIEGDTEARIWRLEIRKSTADSGFVMVFNGDYDSLYHAKQAMRRWRKEVNFRPFGG